jgi:flavin-dependent dehydrogenase
MKVIVADGGHYPIEKACGEGLMPGTVRLLRGLGVEIGKEDGREFCGIEFVDGKRRVHAEFPGGAGIGMRRWRLHEKLAQAAERAGATLLWNTTVTGMQSKGVHAGGNFYGAQWIIGADGIQSRTARWSGLESFSTANRRYARQQHFQVAPWSVYVEIYWGAKSQAYVTPVGENEICVAMLTPDAHARMGTLLAEHDELAERLGKETTVERGAVTGTQRLRRVAQGNVILIGDASGTVDAITGEGLRLGFEHAVAAADAMVSGDLREYERKHRQIARRPGNMAALLRVLDRRPRLRERVFGAFGEAPEIFASLLEAHLGESRLASVLRASAGLGWKLLLA